MQLDTKYAIFFVGPESSKEPAGGKTKPQWLVYVGDQNGTPMNKTYWINSFDRAATLASRMSNDRKLPLVTEARDIVEEQVP